MIPHDWTDIDSANIKRVKFEQNPFDLRGDVLIEFATGKIYKYKDVPSVKVETLVHHNSPGAFFHGHIRGQHDVEPVK